MKQPLRPALQHDWAAVVDGGMRYEISAVIDDLEYPLVVVLADERDESL